MKNNKNSLGNSSTNFQSLSNRIDRINREINPSGTVRSAPSHPPAQRTSRHTWMDRKVRVVKYQSTATPAEITTADIAKQMNDATEDDGILREFCIKKITAWNTTSQAQTSNYIRGVSYAAVTTNNVEIFAEDYGTASSLPGFAINIPDVLAVRLKANSSSTTGVLSLVGYSLGGTLSTTQTYVVDFEVSVLVL